MSNNIVEGFRPSVKKPAGAPPQIVENKIEIRPFHRTEQDIPNWRSAIQNAESQIPRRFMLYSLYADVDLDGHVEAVTGKRKDPIKSANWEFVDKEGRPVDAINQVIDSIGFDHLLDEIMNSRFWGYSMLEPRFWKDDSDKWQMDEGLIPRLNYRPEIGLVSYDTQGNDGINIREGIYAKTVMEVGKVKDLGLYMKAAPYAILKRGGWGDYAAFIQTFGTPLLDATWDGFDETQRVSLNQALKDIGSGGVIIRPAGTNLDVKENNVNATGNAHDVFIKGLNKEISKALLGSTETTESSNSSGYAQSETHQEQDENKHMNDLAFVRKVLNSRFITVLQAAGFDTSGGEFVIQADEDKLDIAQQFEAEFKLATELGLPIDDDYWYEKYGIRKPENYEQLKKAKEELAQKIQSGKKPDPKKKEDPEEDEVKLSEPDEERIGREMDNLVMKFLKRFFPFFFEAPAQDSGASLTCGHHHTINLSAGDHFDSEALIHRVWKEKGKTRFDAAVFYHTADVLIKGFKAGWNNKDQVKLADIPGFVYDIDDPALLAAFEQNLFRFSGAKTLAEIQQLNQIFRQAKSFEEFYQLAKQRTDIFNNKWLETEYNTAYLTGEASATYHRLMAQSEIFPYWEYKTVGDEHVRPEHRLLEGVILPYNDPRWKKIFPPNGWNCRCYIVPRLKNEFDTSKLAAMRARVDAYLGSVQFSKEEAQGWGVNRAEAKEIFTANQQYARKFPGKAAKFLDKLKASDYGLQAYSQAKKAGTMEAPEYDGTATAFYDQLEKLEEKKILRDYSNRPLIMKQKNYRRHTSDGKKKRAHRVGLLKVLQETLKAPDEVWMNQLQLDNINYIKYYKDEAYIVNGKIRNGVMEVITWYKIEEKRSVIDKLRRGLLVVRK